MKKIQDYTSTTSWFKDARREGLTFPVAMMAGLDTAQAELNISFAETFQLFLDHEIIIQSDNFFIYNLQGYKALKNHV